MRSRLAATLLALCACAALADVAVPPVARVTDQTGTLDSEQRAALEQRLAAFEKAKGSQIAVLMVPTTEPEAVEQYALRVAESWKLGRKGVDDGILLLVAKDDRKLRIEVGYGLEGAVPDAIAKRIIEEIITPRFRDGDYFGGLSAGVDQLIHVVDGEPLPPPPRGASGGDDPLGALLPIGFFVLIAAQVLGRLFGELPAALLGGGAFGIAGGALLGSLFAGGAAGVIMFVLLLIVLLSGGKGGWTSGGGGGWSSRGGSFGGGGGGFSGGGGSFGGGGASGGW